MRIKFCLILALCLLASNLKADLGNCVVYQAKFYLKNGTVFNGSFELTGFEDTLPPKRTAANAKALNALAFRRFKQAQQQSYYAYRLSQQPAQAFGKAAVFTTLNYVTPRPLRANRGAELPVYGFVCQDDLVFLDSNEISSIVFWSAERSKRRWLESEILTGAPGMLDTIVHRRYWNKAVFICDATEDTLIYLGKEQIEGPYMGFVAYNYNANINEAALKRLIALKFPFDEKALRQAFQKKYRYDAGQEWTPKLGWLLDKMHTEQIKAIQQWFWARGILLVSIQGTC